MDKSKIIAYVLCAVLFGCLAYTFLGKYFKKSNNSGSNTDSSVISSEEEPNVDTASSEDDKLDINDLYAEDGEIYFTVCSHNLGYFNKSTALRYQGEDAEAQFENWKNTTESLKADFHLCQEYQYYFDKDSKFDTKNIFDPLYRFNKIYSATYGSNGIFSNFRLLDEDALKLKSEQSGYEEADRPAILCSVKLNDDIRVWLASFTLFFAEDKESANLARADQLNMFFENRWIKNSKFAVLAGNFGGDENLKAIFEQNGYQLCNTGTPTTVNSDGYVTDNIAVKGFDVADITVHTDKACTSNHYPITVKLRLKKELVNNQAE